MAPDSLAPIVFGLDFREPALADAEFEVEVCLDGDTGIDDARLVVEVSLALPGVEVEGVFVCH